MSELVPDLYHGTRPESVHRSGLSVIQPSATRLGRELMNRSTELCVWCVTGGCARRPGVTRPGPEESDDSTTQYGANAFAEGTPGVAGGRGHDDGRTDRSGGGGRTSRRVATERTSERL